MSEPFVVKDLEWTPEYVQRFWGYLGKSPHAARAYFSSHSGDGLIAFVRKHVAIGPNHRVLDFGCGPGFLVERLASRGLKTEGLEFSEDSRQQTIERCQRYPSFGGAMLAKTVPTPLPDAAFDVVFLVEVIEHLLPEHIDGTMRELRRILKPGGTVIVTTPHDEDIDAAKTVCPECGLAFHPWQHMGRFTVTGLSARMAGHGFTETLCRAMTVGAGSGAGALRALRRVLGRETPQPHLVYIGRRP
jgi:SAM-dependent methyltransferase